MPPLGKKKVLPKIVYLSKGKVRRDKLIDLSFPPTNLSYKLSKSKKDQIEQRRSFILPPTPSSVPDLVGLWWTPEEAPEGCKKKWIKNLSWAVNTFLDSWKCHIGNLKKTTCFSLTWTLAGLLAEEPYTDWKNRLPLLEWNKVTFNKQQKLKVNSAFPK